MVRAYVAADEWLGGRAFASAEDGQREMVRRYLAALGPATRKDIETWSGLSGLAPTIANLRAELRTFHDEQGRELFDIPDGPLPDPDMTAPPRFLPEWDATLLGHADRSRILPDACRAAVIRPPGRVLPTFLVDGFVAGLWRIERAGAAKEQRRQATLSLTPLVALDDDARRAVAEEGERLLAFLAAGDAHTIAWADEA